MAYGFFPSFFSVDASNDPYWQDKQKIENGRPFFKKYIPVIKEIAAAGWEPVTLAKVSSPAFRIERFGRSKKIFFTVRNNGEDYGDCIVTIDLRKLGLADKFTAWEMVEGKPVAAKANNMQLMVPKGKTRVIQITSE